MENKKSLITDLTVGSVPKELILFAAPLFLSSMLQAVYGLVDMVIVGRYYGSAGLSAVAIGGEVLMFLTFVAMGISSAGQVIISQYVGAGRRGDLERIIGTMFTFLLSCSLVMTLLCLLFRNQVVHWVNAPAESFDYARDYIVTCACGLFFIYGYNLISAILRGMGDSRHPFLFVAVATVINVVLDLLFVAWLGMGPFGAALATVISQACSFIFALSFLSRRREQFGFDFKRESFRIDRQIFASLLKLGVPMMLQSAAISFSKLFITSFVNTYGVVPSAVLGIGNKLAMVTNVFSQAMSTAGSAMIGQCIGAQKYSRVPKVMGTSFAVNGVIASVLATATIFAPNLIFGFFTGDADVLKLALTYIPIAVLDYTSAVLRPPMFSLINGSGNSFLNLMVALLDGVVVRIGLAYVLGQVLGFGVYGFWYGATFASFVPFLIGGAYYLSGKWKTRRYILGE